jgi:4-amino-4-deoxy-L-arabinose transferase-like glycosyltransferase
LILIVGALLSIAWDVATPAFLGPDEAKHFAYIQYLAETGHLPSAQGASVTPGPSLGSTEEREALTVLNLRLNLNERPAWNAVDLSRWHQVEHAMPRGSRANGTGPNPVANNPPLYYAVMAIPYRIFVWLPLLKRVFVLRLVNALFYLATIALVWLLAGEVFPRVRWKQALAAGVVAVQPTLSFVGTDINADNLLIALTTGFLLCALRLVKRGPSLGRVLAPSVLAAAAVLTHGRGLVTLPVLVVALVVAWIKHRPTARETLTLAAAPVGTLGLAFLAYVLFGRPSGGTALYGGQISDLNTKTTFKVSQFLSTVEQFYLPKLPGLPTRLGPEYGYRQVFIEEFYGQIFGSGEGLTSGAPSKALKLLQALSALGLVGLASAVVVRWRRLRRAWPIVVVMAALALTLVAFLHYVSYRALLTTGGKNALIVGRYLLPMISLFALAIAFTVGALPRRLGPLAGAAILGGGVLLCLTDITTAMFRFYG